MSSANEAGSVGFASEFVDGLVTFGPQAVAFRIGSLTPEGMFGRVFGGAVWCEVVSSPVYGFGSCGVGGWFGRPGAS